MKLLLLSLFLILFDGGSSDSLTNLDEEKYGVRYATDCEGEPIFERSTDVYYLFLMHNQVSCIH